MGCLPAIVAVSYLKSPEASMNRLLTPAALAAFALVLLAGCAGKPESAPMALNDSDPHSTNPDRIICRQLPPPTGSHISQDQKVCHTWAEWEKIEKYSQEAVRHGQRMPGQGTSAGPR
jgi:hypothetical protein